jgi:Icc-related predicted phosphoesterase
MRILCISDQVDPLVYSPRVRERFKDIDFVLSAGDLPPEYLGFITSMLNLDLVYVAGNHDLSELEARGVYRWADDKGETIDTSTGAIDAGFRIVKEGGLIILGLPGSMLYNQGPNQYSEFRMSLKIAFLVPRLLLNKLLYGRAVDLVLTHASPQGIHDRDDPCHRGFKCYLWLMRVFKPRWLVHGHIHLYDLADVRISEYGPTTIINAFGHWILDTEAPA